MLLILFHIAIFFINDIDCLTDLSVCNCPILYSVLKMKLAFKKVGYSVSIVTWFERKGKFICNILCKLAIAVTIIITPLSANAEYTPHEGDVTLVVVVAPRTGKVIKNGFWKRIC